MENKSYRILMIIAGALMGVTALTHAFAGGLEIYSPLRESDLAPVPKETLAVIWHYITFHLTALTFAIFYLARTRDLLLQGYILASLLGFGALFFAIGIREFQSLLALPQWIAFALVAVLIIVAIRRA